jgi:hypothetical protein
MPTFERSPYRRCRHLKPRRLHVEALESRAVPAVGITSGSAITFDVVHHLLSIQSPAHPATIELGASGDDHLSLRIGDVLHSADASSPTFDPVLATIPSCSVQQVNLIAGASDSLEINQWTGSGNLLFHTDGSISLLGPINLKGLLTAEAASVTIDGSIRAQNLSILASGLVSVSPAGSVVVGSGDITVSSGYFANTGQLHADGVQGGSIAIHTQSWLGGGTLTASGNRGPGGSIEIGFTQSYTDTAASQIDASSAAGPGGRIDISGGATGNAFSSGRICANGATGGDILLTGNSVALAGASLDASGSVDSGGRIRVGGDFQGQNPAIADAGTVNVAAASKIRSSGRSTGGRVVVWSNSNTNFAGTIIARSSSGGAGFVEVSSHGTLNYTGSADAGQGGTLLLDPKNLIVDADLGTFPQYSLVGATMGRSGYLIPKILTNGNIVVDEPYANQNAGAIYLFDGRTGSLLSMLTGSSNSSKGNSDILELANGNFVISSPDWNNRQGAVTWASSTTGVSGILSGANSLVGSLPGDLGAGFGTPATLALPNGSYLVQSPHWNENRGAVTWGDGAKGITGVISASNSIVGATAGTFDANGLLQGGDQVGSNISVLASGNVVVGSSSWNKQTGAVTWMSELTGLTGLVSAANSATGRAAGDQFGAQITPLTNGNYVVMSNALAGSATWMDGSGPVAGAFTSQSTLAGTGTARLHPLADGNYLVLNPDWNNGRGFVAWGDGVHGSGGTVSELNSLTGFTSDSPTTTGDRVGSVVELSNSNYVVVSPHWNADTGAITWAGGTKGVTGIVSPSNSLVGALPGDRVGGGADYAAGGVVPLPNGNFVVASPLWKGASGAVTWGDGVKGMFGVVSSSNSLVGASGDYVGAYSNAAAASIVPLSNGNYVVASPYWHNWQGAITWANGATGVAGVVSSDNSLVGMLAGSIFDEPGGEFFAGGDLLGSGSVTSLSNGDYVIASPQWNMGRGAVTWCDGTLGSVGTVSATNSLVGESPWTATALWPLSGGDRAGSGGVTALSNGNYVIASPQWKEGRGAVTWANGSQFVANVISPANSLVGAVAGALDSFGFSFAGGDQVGSPLSSGPGKLGVETLANGNYVVTSKFWSTWASGTQGVSGVVSTSNSLPAAPGSYFLGAAGLPDGNIRVFLLFGPNNTLPYPGNATTWRDGATGATLSGENAITSRNTVNTAVGIILESPSNDSFLSNLHTSLRVNFSDVNQLSFAFGASQSITITPNFIKRTLNGGTDVILQASNDITINSPILASPSGPPANLIMRAGRSILINASIDTAGGDLTLVANAAASDGVIDSERDPVAAVILMKGAASISTGAGALELNIAAGADKQNHDAGNLTLLEIQSAATHLHPGDRLGFSINGLTPGDGSAAGTYTQASVVGSLDLTGLRLDLIQTLATPRGSAFTLIHTTGGVTGEFQDLPEGATVSSSSVISYRISYNGANGHDVVLTQISAPPQWIVTNIPSESLLVGTRLNLQAQVQNSTGQLVANYSGTSIIIQSEGPEGGVDLETATATITDGLVTLPRLTLKKPGSYVLHLSSNGVTDATLAINAISTPNQRYVLAVYQDLLGRLPDTGGLNHWVSQLDSATDRTAVAQQLTSSDEYLATVISPAYWQFLGREADQQGLAYWTDRMHKGLSDEGLETQFIASPEFYSHAGGTDQAWVLAMYQALLHRQPDAAGEEYWTQQLAREAKQSEVALGFATSDERESQHVVDIYQKFLGRLAAPDEVNYWLQYFQKGGTNEQIIAQFVAADEYFAEHT